ncbi:MAG: NADH-quinone oxidoreductase subunit J [Ignavibacteriales bacterium]|nr:NADH-quinone oxidoreductase subunit J [Ignavibacteriales bacterium]MCB9210592.1 NADH-quinone oxidoreductase subunit J [Ignavibacteriales bacterium]MCB9219966.1 NADH-quinone oxidoreductase subunit J [Ignavibacteriales bacterium]
MELYDIIFYLFAAITIGSAIVVVNSKNIVHAAFSLLLTFFGVSGIYVLLGADFIAVVQIMVYVGGILILLLFGVMLTNRITNVDIRSGSIQVIPAIIGLAIFTAILFWTMTSTNWKSEKFELPSTTAFQIGDILLSEYVLIFELLGILLLIALIGAASIARRDKE